MRSGARAVGVALLAACACAGFAAAFSVSSTAGADTGTTTTEPPATTTVPPTEPVPTEPAPTEPSPTQPTPAPIPFGVTVGGVKVGGLMPVRATTLVQRSFARPLVLVVSEARKLRIEPGTLGAQANVPKAIRRARVARPGAAVPLDVAVRQARVRGFVDRLGHDVDVEPVDAHLVLDGVKPRVVPYREGRLLRRPAAGREIRKALALNTRTPIELPFATLKPKVVTAALDEAIVILRASNRLLFYNDAKLVRWFGIATGQAQYPTPLGDYEIVTMQRNPWWYPPPSPWAAESDPVPPGPGNPLGTRWMGLSAPYVGIHGTPDAASIGYSASHGCIRMRISDAEWLFRRVKIGTPVFIVAR